MCRGIWKLLHVSGGRGSGGIRGIRGRAKRVKIKRYKKVRQKRVPKRERLRLRIVGRSKCRNLQWMINKRTRFLQTCQSLYPISRLNLNKIAWKVFKKLLIKFLKAMKEKVSKNSKRKIKSMQLFNLHKLLRINGFKNSRKSVEVMIS